MNAKLLDTNQHGAELRYASRKAQTWPGYHGTSPLGKAGYWFGTEENHRYLGRNPDSAELEYLEVRRAP